jgi:putative DNA primase/helicase
MTEQNNRGDNTLREQLFAIATRDSDLFHDDTNVAWATCHTNDGLNKTIRIDSKTYEMWLRHRYYQVHRRGLSDYHVEGAQKDIESHALFYAPMRELYAKTALCNDGAYYFDLSTGNGSCVKIIGNKWETCTNPPIAFRNLGELKANVLPEPGGNLEDFRNLFPQLTNEQWYLLASWMVSALFPSAPYPVLNVEGEQGSGKSTLCELLIDLIAPSHTELKAIMSGEHDLMVIANNCWIICLDNLSGLNVKLSDALCRLSTGGGLAKRKLYSEADTSSIKAARPIILNGIDSIATRADLADRSVVLALKPFTNNRIDTDQIKKIFFEKKPYILGALFDAFAQVINELDNVKLDSKFTGRMVRYAKVGVILEKHMGWEEGSFLAAYNGNITENAKEAVTNNTALNALIDYLSEQKKAVDCTATDLLSTLRARLYNEDKFQLPKNARGLSRLLRREAENLRRLGLKVDFYRTAGDRKVILGIGSFLRDTNDEGDEGDYEKSPAKPSFNNQIPLS